jgi:hypothetical protein
MPKDTMKKRDTDVCAKQEEKLIGDKTIRGGANTIGTT